MAIIHPFKAWKPSPESVENVACLPYDVVTTEQARKLGKGNDQSFLHVIRPEIDLPADTAFNDERVYKQGAQNLQHFLKSGILNQDDETALYIYQLVWDGHPQTGLFGCVSVDDYDRDVILKHELTRPDKEDDRTRHILEQSAHAEPVMFTYKDEPKIAEILSDFVSNNDPIFDFTASDGVEHRIWKVAETDALVNEFADLSHLYIADGHHRCKSASRAAEALRSEQNHSGDEEYNFFPAVMFPMSEMNILAYNRVIRNVPETFITQLEERFDVAKHAAEKPAKKGEVCLFTGDYWMQFTLPEASHPSEVEKLDVYRLHKFILEPMLGIKDPRTDKNIDFVGGKDSTDQLKKLVNKGDYDLALSLYPTAIDELVAISDQGALMPPKSTWFEPKLRSGLLVHTF